MKRKEILVLIGEVLGSRAVYSVASLIITITMLSGITIILRNDIRDIKNYVQSVVDGDPNYKEIHSQVTGSENVIRGNIDLETLLAKEDKKAETSSTTNNISSGYDNYTPTQTITDNYNNKPSNGLNNSNSGETTIANNNNNNSNNNSNNSTNEVNNMNNNSDEDKKEDVLDRSSFNGKDITISEGEPFNPMNGLQLVATDINGKNITNKIVITENNVDTYKPGLYTVKANVTLSDENTLEKEFFVRVEPTILNLVVNDVRASKDILEKNEEFNLSFAVKSSKSYLEVTSVNINNKDYNVKKTSSSLFFRKSNKYEVDLVAPSKGGIEKICIKSVTMSDGTIVDINKNVQIEVLREEAQMIDILIKNVSNESKNISLEYNLQDIDDTIEKAVLYLYNENNIIIQKEEVEKNNKSHIDLNINENGNYKIEIKGYYKGDIATMSEFYKEKELFSRNIEVNKFNSGNIISDKNNAISNEEDLMLMSSNYNEGEVDLGNLVNEFSNETKESTNDIEHEISIEGNVKSDTDTVLPSTISVSVPTNTSFTVDKTGKLISGNMNIVNVGAKSVDIYAYQFNDPSNEREINIKKSISDSDKKGTVALALKGGVEDIYFGSSVSRGIFQSYDVETGVTEADGKKIKTLDQGEQVALSLDGKGGTVGSLENPLQENFTLTLRIKATPVN